jgi:fibro-slime domain-containing protein
MAIRAALLVLAGCSLAACSTTVDGSGGNTAGGSGGADGSGGGGGGGTKIDAGESLLPTAGVSGTTDAGSVGQTVDPSKCSTLKAVIRDFRGFTSGSTRGSGTKHPDFEMTENLGMVTGMVEPTLGPQQKPTLAAGVKNVKSDATFKQWYTDVQDVNMRFEIEIPLTADPSRSGVFLYDAQEFFPIDGKGWGDQYQTHNFDFTTEIHLRFTYKGGESFTFIGDDDLWLFINNKLAIDLGGVHDQQRGTVDLDAKAAELGIEIGKSYPMDIFHAERHVSESHFHMETTIDCFVPIIIP